MNYKILLIFLLIGQQIQAQNPERRFDKIGDFFHYMMTQKSLKFSGLLSEAANQQGVVKAKFGQSNSVHINDKRIHIIPKNSSQINTEGSAAIRIFPFKDEQEAKKAIDEIKKYLATNYCHPNLLYRPALDYAIGGSQFLLSDAYGNYFAYSGNLDFSSSAYECPESSNACIEIRFNDTEEISRQKKPLVQTFVSVTEPKGFGEFHQQIRTLIEISNKKNIDALRVGMPLPNSQKDDYNVYFRSKLKVKGLATDLIVHPYIRALLGTIDTTKKNQYAYFVGNVYSVADDLKSMDKVTAKGNEWIKYLSAAVGGDFLYTIKDYEDGISQFIATSKNPLDQTIIYLNVIRKEKSGWIDLMIKNQTFY